MPNQILKHFLQKNEIIDNTTNLKSWYKKNIENKILTKLEEFQERDSGSLSNYSSKNKH